MINPRLTPSPARISATKSFWTKRLLTLTVWLLTGWLAWGNLAGGGTGTGPAVTLTDSGSTVTIANGIISLLCTKSGATINQINYTYNNGGGTVTNQVLSGGNNGGQLYWELGGFGTGSYTYTLVSDPASNGGAYAEISLLSSSGTNGLMEVHFSMLRGSTGFYVTAIWGHRSTDGPMGMGETRDNIYAGSIFNWMSVDATRNRVMEVSGGSAIGVQGAPVEVSLWTNGMYAGQYEDKYKYSADLGVNHVWGWSSVGVAGKNVGLWNISASSEYCNGGPLKRELMEHIGTTILNMHNGGHYGMGSDGNFANGEIWTKVYGPYFIYCNNVTNTLTSTNLAAQALYNDALAQGAAEQAAWPYYWFTNANYALAGGRGTITGKFVINDSGNPNASAGGLWVGAIQQPSTTTGTYDFQQWMKPYQFWVKTDTNGNFTLPAVIAGANYTLYAFGPGAPAIFMSQNQTGGNPPVLRDVPATPFSVTVTGGATNNLGTITWTPARVGPTVFEIGYPSRVGNKFRHGDDWWVGEIGPSPAYPSPIWSRWLEYPFDFPGGLNYVVGSSRWNTDWNFILPVVTDSAGNYNSSTATITFNLATAPTNGAQACLYLGLTSDYYSAIILTVNGNNLGSVSGVTGTPTTSIPTSGYYTGYSDSDSNIREGNNAAASDERITFPGSQLHAGANTITIGIRQIGGSYFADHAMYDYLRLELTGYVPPAPASVIAYPGNNCNLVCWPVTPGATSYNLLRSTTSGTNYASITNGVTGPVCGSGTNNATYLDTTTVNGTTYYYVIRSVNPTGSSTNSPQSSAVTPSASIAATTPAAPTGLTVSATGHQSVSLTWNPSAGASFYSLWRSTLVNTGGGSSNTLSTIPLNNTNTGTTFTDNALTDGSIYSYTIAATGPGGTSTNSAAVIGVPLPAAPATSPGSLTGSFVTTNITLNWSAVSGAVGYAIYRGTSASGPFTYLQTITETTYKDYGLNTNNNYFYNLYAMNTGGVSTNATVVVLGAPIAPGLSAIAGNTLVTLNWSAVVGATNYILQTATTTGGPYTALVNTTNTTFIQSNLVNGMTYYYVVYSQGPNGQSPLSTEASATPSLAAGGFFWINPVTSAAQSWNVNGNWNIGTAFPNGAQTIATVNSAIAAAQTINLNQAITVGSLSLGTGGGAFTLAAGGGTLTFDNTPGTATLLEMPASKGDIISAPITINGSLLVTNSSTNTLSISGNITGTGGTLSLYGNSTLSGTDSYAGGTTLNSGNLTFSAGSAIPATGTLTLNGNATVNVVTANGLPSVLINGTNAITGNGNSGTGIASLNEAGQLTLYVSGGSKVFDLTGSVSGSGTLTLGSAAMTLRLNGTSGNGGTLFNLGTGANYCNIRNGPFGIALGGLAGGANTFLQGASSAATTATFTIGGANASARFDGTIQNGGYTGNPAVVIVKTGTGTQTLTGANTYTGGTTINGGTLLVSNLTGSATGSGTVTAASGGTLAGSGIISGNVTINAGGTLAPGNATTTLTLGNNLTLTSGSTTIMQLSHSPTDSTTVSLSGTLNAGGTLIVTNAGGTALAAGDTFNLFNAASYGGSFASVILPALATGLAWNTSTLNTSGILSVVAASKPVFGNLSVTANGLNFSGTGGVAGATYYLLGSTNVTIPAGNWTRLLTNQFDGSGNFNFTNSLKTNTPQSFYQLQVP